MTQFFETETKLEIAEIIEVEKFVGLDFPNEYREHLLKYNGGRCMPKKFSFIENGNETTSSVDWFLAIYDGKYDNLKKYIETYKIEERRLPNDLLPIAHDAFGNLICISCAQSDFGKIYFWDHENEVDYNVEPESNRSNIFLVASSLPIFLDRLM